MLIIAAVMLADSDAFSRWKDAETLEVKVGAVFSYDGGLLPARARKP